MKIAITGKNGNLVKYIIKYFEETKLNGTVSSISLKEPLWKETDFSQFDCVVHLAALTDFKQSYDSFRAINVELTRDLFTLVSESGCPHFVFLSSMAVFDGVGWGFGSEGHITDQTRPVQSSFYGRSKFEAEEAIRKVQIEKHNTKVAIIRSPSIVGKGMEDYFKSYKYLTMTPLVPFAHTESKRSFVHVHTIAEILMYIIRNRLDGVFYPQNLPLLSPSEIAYQIRKSSGLKCIRLRVPTALIPRKIEKTLFEQVYYDEAMTSNDLNIYQICRKMSSYEAIERTKSNLY